MNSPYRVGEIANALLQNSFNEQVPLSHLKLQKLLFFAHGYFLAATGRPLVDELFVIGPFGPINISLWYKFAGYGNAPIADLVIDDATGMPFPAPLCDAEVDRVIKFVTLSYLRRSDLELSSLAHKSGGAWDRARGQIAHSRLGPNWKLENYEIKADFDALTKRQGHSVIDGESERFCRSP